MNKFKKLKKALALVLVFCMVMGSIPATAFASTEKPIDAAILFSDLHSMYKGDSTEGSKGYKKELVTNMMTTLKNTGLNFSSVTSVGDAFSSNETAYTGKTSIITGYIRAALGNTEIPVNYTWSDHDRAALAENDKDKIENKSGLIYGAGKDGIYGNADDGNYYIYAISHSDTSSAERYNQPSTFTEQKLVDFKNAVAQLDSTKPIFIASHQPLLARRSDNQYAYKWCTAINEVAESRDVAYFFGHNHYYDKAGDYFYEKGQTMTVQNGNSTKSVKLNFTHICTGYFDPATTGYAGSSRQGTVMVATIYEDSMKFTTYNKNGVYTGNEAVDRTITRDHKPVVEEPETPVVPEDTEITVGRANVVVSGATINTSSEVSADDQVLIDEKNYEDVIGLDIDATIANEKATLKFTVPNDWEDKTDRIVGISSENGELKEIEGEYDNGFYTFEVEHFSAKGIAVVAETPTIKSAALSSDKGAVERGKTAITGSKLSVRYSNDETETVALTVGMLSGDFNTNANGVYTGLTVTYNGYTVTEAFALEVVDVAGNNYPEYPDEGAVKVNKTATGIDFQSSGLAQVEVSASGIPIEKGVDVIVMVDTSSSMDRHIDCGEKSCKNSNCSKVTRHTELIKALNALKSEFQKKNENNEYQDIRVSFADFNGFFGQRGNTTFEGKTLINSPYDYDSADYTDTAFGADGNVHVISGNTISYDAFMTPDELSNVDFTEFVTDSGTNYDYALDVIYQLGHAAKVHNKAAGEERDLKVIFMTDGAANQFNYYGAVGGSSGSSKKWDNWLLGSWKATDLTKSNLNCTDHKYYYDLVDHDGDGFINEHRMANAIKGSTDPNKTYEIIRKSTAGLEDILPEKHTNNLYNVPGLGAEMYAIAFAPANDGDIDEASMIHSVSQIASDKTNNTKYFYEVEASAGLDEVFSHIASEIRYAATNARFVDKMGDDFNLKLGDHTYLKPGSTSETEIVKPKIEIISYDVYTQADAEEGKIPSDKNIGDRKGTFKILETVTFNTTGTQAYSDKIGNGTTNILGTNGVINANTFMFNTTASGVAIDGVKIPTGTGLETTNVLPAETFYWKMGTVQSKELAMRYYVYLEGSMEGEKKAGSYPTNKYAILYYDNYLGNAAQKPTSSPVMPWIDANVSYAFYLVDKNGNPIVNQTTGQTGSFANKVTVAGPKVYDSILMNDTERTMTAKEVAIAGLPDEYKLYDATYDSNGVLVDSVEYGIRIRSNSTGAWRIDSPKNTQTTYVTNYDTSDPTAYSNALEMNLTDHDYTHTTVWFAVTVGVEANPDTVVVDYGLPVDISVLENDRFVKRGTLAGVGPMANANLGDFNPNTDTTIAEGFATEYNGTKYGKVTANLENGKVRYTPSNMKMNGYDKFAYAVNYSAYINSGYYYDTVTVIPATTIYYEDSFVDFKVYEKNVVDENTVWDENKNETWLTVTDDKANSDVTQAEDRPGLKNSELNGLYDADNVYGYDSAYDNMSTYSLGSARKITVDESKYGTATFDFWGTGFDVIALTSNTTGTITVQVQKVNADNSLTNVKNYIVDTYYGYTRDENGNWVVNQNAANSLYQVPVIETANIGGYGHYKVTIKAAYGTLFDHVKESTAYDLYIDAIRIYDPANDGANDEIIKDAYIKDGEYLPEYVEVRNELIAANDFYNLDDNTNTNGIIFIDGSKSNEEVSVEDYKKYGPNNEVYLKSKQSIAFDISNKTNVKDIQIGLKSADGNPVDYSISGKTGTLNTSTGMYYSILEQSGETIVITNTSENDSILSVTDIKFTYAEDVAIEPSSMIFSSRSTLNNAKKIMTEDPKVYSVTTDKETYVPGETVTVTVKTNKATTAVKVNGKNIEEFREKGNDRYWTFKNTADSLGELEFTVVAYNELNEETDVVNTEVMVEKFVPKTFKLSLDKTSAVVKDKVKATVTTSDDVEYVTINDYKVTKYTYNKVNKTKTWLATFNLNTLGERTIKAVAYDKYGNAAAAVSKTVVVKKYAPKMFKFALSKSTAVVKDKVKATVTTSDDVKYVTINGYKVTKYTYNKANKTKTWSRKFRLNILGKRTIKAVAYNANGSASNAISKSVTVKNFAPKTFKVSLDKSKIKKGAKYTVTVTTSSTVKYVTVNGKKVTKNTYSSKTGLRTFKVTCTAANTGKRTVKVYAFNTNGAKSALKTKTLTVTKK